MIPASIRQLGRKLAPPSVVLWHQARYARKYGEAEIALVPVLCDPMRDALDVGANDGHYAYVMRRHAARTHAFEPVAQKASELRWKFGQSITVHQVALSSTSGTGHIAIPLIAGQPATGLASVTRDGDPAPSAETRIEQAELSPLDRIYQGDAGLIKIDVEGHERDVLTGAAATIDRCRPILLVEAEERHSPGTLDFIRHFFAQRNYRGVFLHNGGLQDFAGFDPLKLQDPRLIAAPGLHLHRRSFPDYVNNFLFLPLERANHLASRMAARLDAVSL